MQGCPWPRAACCRVPQPASARWFSLPTPSTGHAFLPPSLPPSLPPFLPPARTLQYSLGGGVVVQVTGIMQRPGGPKRPFVQTFFLAVQEKGYYVLNDMFRWALLGRGWPDGGSKGLSWGAGEGLLRAGRHVQTGSWLADQGLGLHGEGGRAGALAAVRGCFAVGCRILVPHLGARSYPSPTPSSPACRFLPHSVPQGDNGAAAVVAAAPAAPVAVAPPPPAAAAAAAPAVPAVPRPAPAAAAAVMMQQQQVVMQQLAMAQQAALAQQGSKPNGVAAAPAAAAPIAVQYHPSAAPVPGVPVAVPLPGARPQQQHAPAAATPPAAPGAAPTALPQGRPAGGKQPEVSAAASYAERLRQGGSKPASTPGSPSKQQQQQQQQQPAQQPQPAPAPAPPAAEQPAAAQQGAAPGGAGAGQTAAEAVPVEEVPNASIFVRGIPASVTMEQLVAMLSQVRRRRSSGVGRLGTRGAACPPARLVLPCWAPVPAASQLPRLIVIPCLTFLPPTPLQYGRPRPSGVIPAAWSNHPRPPPPSLPPRPPRSTAGCAPTA